MVKSNWRKKDEFGRFSKKKDEDKIYAWLLDYESINNWIDDYTSKGTRESNLFFMNRFLRNANLTPDQLIEMQPLEIRKIYNKIKQKYLQEGKSSSAKRFYLILKTFLEANDVEIRFKRRDKVTIIPKSIKRQYIPSKDEIYNIADNSGSLRNRAIILVVFQSGIRSNALRKLNYGLVKSQLDPLKVPVIIRISADVDTKISKYIGYYYTFLQDEGAEALKSYIEHRINVKGWQPEDSDLIFVSKSNFVKDNKNLLITLDTINRVLKKSARSIGIDPKSVWAHLLRKSFRKVLYKSTMNNDMAEAIMGHQISGSRENYFDRHDIDWISSEYMKAPFSREGVGRMDSLQKENLELKEELGRTKESVEKLQELFEEIKSRVKD